MTWLWIVLTTFMYVLSVCVVLLPYGSGSMIKQVVIVGVLGAALCLHGGLLYTWIDIAPGQNLTPLNLFSMMAWLMTIWVWCLVWFDKGRVLQVVTTVLSVLSLYLVLLFPEVSVVHTAGDIEKIIHIIFSIVTVSILSVCLIQALLVVWQGRQLRLHPGRVISVLSMSLEGMDRLLFTLVGLSFAATTVFMVTTLLFFFSDIMSDTLWFFKFLLMCVGWAVLGILCIGRLQWGWHGRQALLYAGSGFVCLGVMYWGGHLFRLWGS